MGLIGGWFILMFAIIYLSTVFFPILGSFTHISGWIWNLRVAGLTILGAIFAFGSKRPNGPILLTGGLFSIILGIIYFATNYALLEAWQYSFFTYWNLSWPESIYFLVYLKKLFSLVSAEYYAL